MSSVHYIGWGCQSFNPKKYTVLNVNFVFDLYNIELHDSFSGM
jgi:hypothetical protein